MPSEAINILGVQVHLLTAAELVNQIALFIEKRERALILNVNTHALNLAYEHTWLHDYLNQADIVFCDGIGVIFGARLLGQHIPERLTPADWFSQLGEMAEARGYSLYFLGAKPGIAEKAAKILTDQFPRLRIAGIRHGYFDKTPGSIENEEVIRDINSSAPDIIVLGMGMPMQERWFYDNWDQLDVRIGLTGGGFFDILSGELRRPPPWMTNNGLEWLGRLLIEPSRLWRRYLIGNPRFLLNVLKERFKPT